MTLESVVSIGFCAVGAFGCAWIVPKVWRRELAVAFPNEDAALRKRFQIPDVVLTVGRTLPASGALLLVGLIMAVAQAIEDAAPDPVGGVLPGLASGIQDVCLPILVLGFPFFVLVATTGWPSCVIPPQYRRRRE